MLNNCHVALDAKVEDENEKSFCPENKQSANIHEQIVTPLDIDQNKELESGIQQSTSSSMESLVVVTEVATGSVLERNTMLDSVAAGGAKMDNLSVSLPETSYSTAPNEATQELFEKVEHHTSDLTVQIADSEAAHTEKCLESKIEGSRVTDSSKVSGK